MDDQTLADWLTDIAGGCTSDVRLGEAFVLLAMRCKRAEAMLILAREVKGPIRSRVPHRWVDDRQEVPHA